MALNSSFTLSVVAGDGVAGNTNMIKQITGLTFAGTEVDKQAFPQTIGVSAPAQPVCTPGTGGSMAAGNYLVKITYVNAPQGETDPSPESTSQTVASSGKLTVTSPAPSGSATGYNVYITAAGGSAGTETLQNVSPIAIGTNYVQSAAVSGGAALPGSNTTLTYAPSSPLTPYQTVYIRNVGSGTQVVTVSVTPQGGSSHTLPALLPMGVHASLNPTAGVAANPSLGGITALSIAVSAALTPVELFLVR